MIRHGPEGAMGFVINRVLAEDWAGNILNPGSAPEQRTGRKIAVHYGGPVGTTEGFILHSGDYSTGQSTKVTGKVWLSVDPGILREMARRDGPVRSLFILGYSGWAPGQLESELARDDWVIAPGDTRAPVRPRPRRTSGAAPTTTGGWSCRAGPLPSPWRLMFHVKHKSASLT